MSVGWFTSNSMLQTYKPRPVHISGSVNRARHPEKLPQKSRCHRIHPDLPVGKTAIVDSRRTGKAHLASLYSPLNLHPSTLISHSTRHLQIHCTLKSGCENRSWNGFQRIMLSSHRDDRCRHKNGPKSQYFALSIQTSKQSNTSSQHPPQKLSPQP